MVPDGLPEPLTQITKAGGMFKFGTGILGRSAVVLVVVLLLFITVAWRVHSELLLIALLVLGVAVFFVWFFTMLKFAKSDPAAALLEGAEWRKFQNFEPSAKNHLPAPADQVIVPAPRKRLPKTVEAQVSDKELGNG